MKKYEMLMGSYSELREYFSMVAKKYEGKSTKFFDMPSEGIDEQFKSLLDEQQAMGLINYCKVLRHRKDPIVEVVAKFIYIEDIYHLERNAL